MYWIYARNSVLGQMGYGKRDGNRVCNLRVGNTRRNNKRMLDLTAREMNKYMHIQM